MTYFCITCLKETKEIARLCPFCGVDLSKYRKKHIEKALINALRQKETETVRQAVYILGKLKSSKAVRQLSRLYNRTNNILLKIEIIDSLKEIGAPEARKFMIKTLIQMWNY